MKKLPLILCLLFVNLTIVNAQSIIATIDEIVSTSECYDESYHKVYLDINVNLGLPEGQLQFVNALYFDLAIQHNSGQDVQFAIEYNELTDIFQSCMAAADANIELLSQPDANPLIVRFSADYSQSSIPANQSFCNVLATATREIVIDPLDTYDICSLETVETDFQIDVINSNLSVGSGSESFFSFNYSETFDLPVCSAPIVDEGDIVFRYDIDNISPGNAELDFYLRSNTPANTNISGVDYNTFSGALALELNGGSITSINSLSPNVNITNTGTSFIYLFNLDTPYAPNEDIPIGNVEIGWDGDISQDCIPLTFNIPESYAGTDVWLNVTCAKTEHLCGGGLDSVVGNGFPTLISSDGEEELIGEIVKGGKGGRRLASALTNIYQISNDLWSIELDTSPFYSNEDLWLDIYSIDGKSIYKELLGSNELDRMQKLIRLEGNSSEVIIFNIYNSQHSITKKVILKGF